MVEKEQVGEHNLATQQMFSDLGGPYVDEIEGDGFPEGVSMERLELKVISKTMDLPSWK